jgi:hypothetical protein
MRLKDSGTSPQLSRIAGEKWMPKGIVLLEQGPNCEVALVTEYT